MYKINLDGHVREALEKTWDSSLLNLCSLCYDETMLNNSELNI